MLAWFVISRHHLHRTVPRPTSSLPPTAPFPLSPFPATLPKSLSVTPVFATPPRPPGGRYLTSQPALHPLPCIPSPCPPIPLSCYSLSFHTLAHSFALTKTSTLLFSMTSALFAKNQPGGRDPFSKQNQACRITLTNQSEGENSGKLDGWQSGCNYWRKPGHRPGHRPALRPGRRGRGLLLPLQQSGSRGSRGGHSEAGSQGCGIPMRRGPRCGRPKIHHRRRRAIRKDRHPREQRGTRTPRRFLGRHRRRLRRGPKRQFERSFLYHPGVREASHASKSRRQGHQHQLRARRASLPAFHFVL